MKYRVTLEKTEEGYAVWCPGLPGCWSQGATEEEALKNIKDAIETYLATIEELTKTRSQSVERPSSRAASDMQSNTSIIPRRGDCLI